MTGAGRIIDKACTIGVIALLAASPLALGAVHPWPSAIVEAVCFLLLLGLVAKMAIDEDGSVWSFAGRVKSIWLPLGLFLAWASFQLVPLPPAVLGALSPSTHQLYSRSLAGWPDAPLGDVVENIHSGKNPQPAATATERAGEEFRPISIQPELTALWLLRIFAYAAVFAVVLLYPFGSGGDTSRSGFLFSRTILRAIVVIGLLVAVLGVVEMATWNGKMLWVFVPFDWGKAEMFRAQRARGPFINADHFANYLNLIFPLAISGALFPTFLEGRNDSGGWRLFSGVTAFLLFGAIVLSLSRAGWIGAAAGVGALIWMCGAISPQHRPAFLRGRFARATVGLSLLLLLLVTVLTFVGGSSRDLLKARVDETVAMTRMGERVGLWRDSTHMIRQFPVFGVGLGDWAELFPQFRSAPWARDFFRETHNDYLELMVEAGIVGFILLAWFFTAVVRCLRASMRKLNHTTAPVYYALLAGFLGMAFHEAVDFSLHIPANAILFAVLIALALRMHIGVTREAAAQAVSTRFRSRVLRASAAAALVLTLLALGQPKFVYPNNLIAELDAAKSVEDARRIALDYPGNGPAHALIVRDGDSRLPLSIKVRELETAVWLQPTNPSARDALAGFLFEAGQNEDALHQITQSVYDAPFRWAHWYMSDSALQGLTPAMRSAIRAGFDAALTARFPGAAYGFAEYYRARGEPGAAGDVYARSANLEKNLKVRGNDLMTAAQFYAQAGRRGLAEACLRQAIAGTPTDAAPYAGLITQVYGPEKKLEKASAVARQAIAAGADAETIYLALGEGAKEGGDFHLAEEALQKAAAIQPWSDQVMRKLGEFYLATGHYDEAAAEFSKLVQITPSSPQAFLELAQAEEGAFRFSDARAAYRRAVELAPDDRVIGEEYNRFVKRVSDSAALGAPSDNPRP